MVRKSILHDFHELYQFVAKYPDVEKLIEGLLNTPIRVIGERDLLSLNQRCLDKKIKKGDRAAILFRLNSAVYQIMIGLDGIRIQKKDKIERLANLLIAVQKARRNLERALRYCEKNNYVEDMVALRLEGGHESYFTPHNQEMVTGAKIEGIIPSLRYLEMYLLDMPSSMKHQARDERMHCWSKVSEELHAAFKILNKRVSKESLIKLIQGTINYSGLGNPPETEAFRKKISQKK